MKKVLISGGTFLGILFLHLLTTIAFLFLGTEPLSKALWMCALLLLAGIALAVAETVLNIAEQDQELDDYELAQAYMLKGTVSSILCAAALNTAVYIANVIYPMPKLVTGGAALLFALVCIVNVIALLFAQRGSAPSEQDDLPEEPIEESV